MPAPLNRREFLGRSAALLAGAAGAAALPAANLEAREAIARPPATRFPLSCAAYSFRQYLDLKKPAMTLEDFIEKCAGWGTDGVELTEYYFPKPVTPEYAMRLKKKAFLWGQTITGTPIGNNFTLPPGPERDRQIRSVRNWIDVSADLGSPAIRIFAGSAPRGVDEAQARKWTVECIEACAVHAARRGVFLALENHHGVVAEAEGLLEIVRAVRSEWFGVNMDTGNFQTADPYGDLAKVAPYTVTCQVKTEITVGGKRQEVDLERIAGILRKTSYRGFVTLEYEAAEDPLTAVPRYLEKMRKVLG